MNAAAAPVGGLKIHVSHTGATAVIAIEGELDIATASALDAALRQLEREEPEAIVLDMGGLRFIDSTGIRLLIEASKRSGADSNRLTLIPSAAKGVTRVLALTGLEDRLPFARPPETR